MLHSKTKILLYSSNLWVFADGMLGPLLAVFTKKIGGDILEISWAWAIYLMVTGVLSIAIGRLSDRVSKEKLMVSGYGLTALFTFGYLLVSKPWHLFAIQAGLGVALALCNPTWYALYAKYSEKDREGYTWGLADGQGKIVTGLSILVGGALVYYFSFNVLFVTMGTLLTAATIYQVKILKN